MSKYVQIRHVPDDVHRTLKERAARAGMSLSDYLLRVVIEHTTTPSIDDVLERILTSDVPQR